MRAGSSEWNYGPHRDVWGCVPHWCMPDAVHGVMVPIGVCGAVVPIGVCGPFTRLWDVILTGIVGDVVLLGQLSVQSL